MSTSRRFAFLLLTAYWIVMFVGTHVPLRGENLPIRLGRSLWGLLPLDKVLHFSGYLGLTFLMAWVWIGLQSPRLRSLIVIFGIAAVYAALDEWSQEWVETRSGDVRDWVADCAGALTGLILFLLVNAWWTRGRGQGKLQEARSTKGAR